MTHASFSTHAPRGAVTGETNRPGGPNAPASAGRRRAIHAYVSANRPAIGRLLRGDFEIRTMSEAEKLATMLGSHCPDPEQAAIGFWELLANAVEHGSFEIDFAMKSALLLAGTYHAELKRRGGMAPFRDRVVRVQFRQFRRSIRVRIADQGRGFDFAAFGPDFSPHFAPNGRGIAMARQMVFSTLTYLGAGNIVEASIRR